MVTGCGRNAFDFLLHSMCFLFGLEHLHYVSVHRMLELPANIKLGVVSILHVVAWKVGRVVFSLRQASRWCGFHFL